MPTGSWSPLGPAPVGPPYQADIGFGRPNSGRVTGVANIPSGTHAGRVVAATAGGGVWTSDDSGTTWIARTDQAASLAIGSVTVDPSNPAHLIAGTGEANNSGDSYPGFGILVSSDGGDSWVIQDPGGVFDDVHIGAVAIDPSNANHEFAGTDNGLYVTADGGRSWALPTDPSYCAYCGHIDTVQIDPANPATVYIGGGAEIVAKSTDGGLTWTSAATGINQSGELVAVALAPSNPGTLYASIGTSRYPVQLYKSINGGANWSLVVNAPDYTGVNYFYGGGSGEQGWYDNVLAIDPANANHVLAGGIALVETVDGGASWSGKPSFGTTYKLHPDQHALSFRPDGKVWVGDDGGVYQYDPANATVANANGNLNITQLYYGFNEVGGELLAGSQDNGSASTNSPTLAPWTGIYGCDGGPSAITPNHTQTQFIQCNRHLLRTTDAFTSVPNDITPPQTGLFTPPDAVVPNAADPANPTVFYGGQNLYRTTNPAATPPSWTAVTSVGSYVTAIATSATNPAVVYVGFKDGTVEVSTDGGVTFTSLAAQPFYGDTWVTGLSVDPGNPKVVTASVSYSDTRYSTGFPHVAQYSYTTTPDSGSWTVISGNLPATAAVSRVVYDNGALVAATDAGVYATGAPNGDSTVWSLVGNGLPKVQVQDLFVDPGSSDLYAVTHGRGAWKLPAPASAGPAGAYTAQTPCRLFDTRDSHAQLCQGAQAPVQAPVGANGTLRVKVTGVNGVPDNATAVAINLTGVDASGPTYVTSYPDAQSRPLASSLNLTTPAPLANFLVVTVGAGGYIDLYNFSGTTDLLADLQGYFAPNAGLPYAPVAPCRVFDTRGIDPPASACANPPTVAKAPVGAGAVLKVKVAGVGSIPTGVSAVGINLTGVDATNPTFVTAYPDGANRPLARSLNLSDANPAANFQMVTVSPDGYIDVYNLTGTVDLLADVQGYVATTASTRYTATAPCRAFDTRGITPASAACSGAPTAKGVPLGDHGKVTVQVAGVNNIPSGVKAVAINLTAVDATGSTYLTAYPDGTQQPLTSTVNVNNANPLAHFIIVAVGADGSIDVSNFANTTNVLGDIQGYFVGKVTRR